MGANPETSIIIPSYNRAHVLARAVKSALGQHYQCFEVIIVDDCSSDGTESMCRTVFPDERIRVIRHQVRRGAAAARNTGAFQARGRFVSFLDSDDEWSPDKLAQEVEFLKRHPKSILCSTGAVVIDEACGTVIHRSLPQEIVVTQAIAVREFGYFTNDFTVTREAFLAVHGFDEDLPAAQDADIWIRLAAVGSCQYLPRYATTHFIRRRDEISHDTHAKIRGVDRVFEKHRSLFTADTDALFKVQLMRGFLYVFSGNNNAVDYFRAARTATSSFVMRAMLTVIIMSIAVLRRYGVKVIAFLYAKTHPRSYLLW